MSAVGISGLQAGEDVKLLAFTAGILLTVAVEEMLVEAHTLAKDNRPGEDPLETVALIGGFALFALISAYLA